MAASCGGRRAGSLTADFLFLFLFDLVFFCGLCLVFRFFGLAKGCDLEAVISFFLGDVVGEECVVRGFDGFGAV